MKYFKVLFLSLLMFVTPLCIFADDLGWYRRVLLAGFYSTSAEVDLTAIGAGYLQETWNFRFDPNGTVILIAEPNAPAIHPFTGETWVSYETPGLGVWKRTGKRTLKFAVRFHIRDEVGLSLLNPDLTVGGLAVGTATVNKMGEIKSVDGQFAIIDEDLDTLLWLPVAPGVEIPLIFTATFEGGRETVDSLESLMDDLISTIPTP